jgi:hypothetical protein
MSSPVIVEPIRVQADNLESLMQRRLGNRVRDLRVLIRPAGVILQGRTATYHAKQLAQHAAMELSSLPILANEIEVR